MRKWKNSMVLLQLVFIAVMSVLLASSAAASEKMFTKSDPYGLAGKTHIAVTPKSRNNWWTQRHLEILARIAKGNVDLIFIGDSITHGFDSRGRGSWEKYYGQRNAVNMGFSGDHTENVLWRLDNGEIDGINPKLAVLLIGTNNNKETAEEVADGIKAIVQKMRAKMPKTRILILGIFPKGSAEQMKDKNQDATLNPLWVKNDKTNEIVSKIADNKHIFYLNINNAFLDTNGVFSREISNNDLLHLSVRGFEIWAKTMEPAIKMLMMAPDGKQLSMPLIGKEFRVEPTIKAKTSQLIKLMFPVIRILRDGMLV